MNRVEFTVRGTPKPQPRPKARLVKPRAGKPFIQIYTPSTGCENWRKAVAWAGQREIPAPLTGPLEVEIVVYIDRPQRLKTKRADQGAVRADGCVGDADHYAKAVLDALHGVAFANDAQVTDLISRKRYAAAGCQPGARIRVAQVDMAESLFAG
jgi:Holliday junction resolvase RusA-like endonuclease